MLQIQGSGSMLPLVSHLSPSLLPASLRHPPGMLHVLATGLACTTRHVRALMRQRQGRLGWVWLNVMGDEAIRWLPGSAQRMFRAWLVEWVLHAERQAGETDEGKLQNVLSGAVHVQSSMNTRPSSLTLLLGAPQGGGRKAPIDGVPMYYRHILLSGVQEGRDLLPATLHTGGHALDSACAPPSTRSCTTP